MKCVMLRTAWFPRSTFLPSLWLSLLSPRELFWRGLTRSRRQRLSEPCQLELRPPPSLPVQQTSSMQLQNVGVNATWQRWEKINNKWVEKQMQTLLRGENEVNHRLYWVKLIFIIYIALMKQHVHHRVIFSPTNDVPTITAFLLLASLAMLLASSGVRRWNTFLTSLPL